MDSLTPTEDSNPTPQPVPNLNPAPSGPSPHHRITPWVALVIVAAIAATVGYLVWAKAHEAWPFDFDGPWSEVKRGGPSTSLGTTGDYAGWKTYRNEEYGFEVKYPVDWDFKQDTAFDYAEGFFFTKSTSTRILILPKGEFDYGPPWSQPKVIDAIFGGKRVKMREWDLDGQGKLIWNQLIENHQNWNICPADLKNCNRIDAMTSNDDSQIVNQILSTFKFIKPVAQNSCERRNYNNDLLGFSMDYYARWGEVKAEGGSYGYRVVYGTDRDVDYFVDNPGIDYLSVHWDYNNSSVKTTLSPEESAMVMSGNPGFEQKTISLDGRTAIETSYIQYMEYTHGSGVEYAGPRKPYIIRNIFTDNGGRTLVITYGKPQNEPVPCSFDQILSTFKFN